MGLKLKVLGSSYLLGGESLSISFIQNKATIVLMSLYKIKVSNLKTGMKAFIKRSLYSEIC